MKISVLTATYNRGKYLEKLYQSLLKNSKYGVNIEWLIMDDGSTDETQNIIKKFSKDLIEIKNYKQENAGKMVAINELMKNATGDLIVDCDSDDYFTNDAFKIILQRYEENKEKKGIYGFCFLHSTIQRKKFRKNICKKTFNTICDAF